MDNLAHALVGAALGRAVADRHVPHAALIGVIAANAPDWTEFLVGLPGTRADYLTLHRGITHSIMGALIEIAAITLLIGLAWRSSGARPPWRWIWACVGIAVLSHLYMDWQGSYGWRPFLPWSNRWYYLDWVAIADPFFWLLPLVALAWGAERHWRPLGGFLLLGAVTLIVIWRSRDVAAEWVLVVYAAVCVAGMIGWVRYWFGPVMRRRAAALGLAVLAVYAGAQAVGAQIRKQAIRHEAIGRFGPDARWAGLTNIGRPFTWQAIYASADTVAGDGWEIPRHLQEPPVARALRDTRDGRAIGQFARFLAAEVDAGGKVVYLRDARYARAGHGGWAVVRITTDSLR
jgi:membrane-bound metal-dependent hydrolase YbcI (DUF457 family)